MTDFLDKTFNVDILRENQQWKKFEKQNGKGSLF